MRATGAGALALLMATGCSAASAGEENQQGKKGSALALYISPANGGRDLLPGHPIRVDSANGALTAVTVTTKGKAVPGIFSADRTRWRSLRPMLADTQYSVAATTAAGSARSAFSTLKPKSVYNIEQIIPNKDISGLTVGVGMPIMVSFDKDIADRVSVERNLFVQASKPVEGAWHWFDNKTIAYRPKHFWPAHTKVRFTARLSGVRGADGMYGVKDYVRDFKIGRSQISTADVLTHMMKIKRDGKLIRSVPISAGKGGVTKYHTTNGIHLAMSREPVTVMTSPDAGPGQAGYYSQTVYNTVRISNSGEYVHSAPWSVGSQGYSNVSHGCVNISPENARWFIDNTLIGDPIIVTGSPRVLEPLNGWGHWQESWPEWLKWSRLRAAETDSM
ncbi:hypothetical protein Aple_048170 [Acrocarpospora pleiomorpha]|uniref:L,D-TPase catalytic domain-containing protein n=1 Tax=Acrocarpospora pleiomorpha TaxID=90975 RepID=A0A5M3XLU0_9ACTN|nr:Ig-like domain-containing protein [Acrocarpospora pleiomorpha]GES21920.1 hypothetical protein Aple_048170 [Acrocarpospora pleiomorpha]